MLNGAGLLHFFEGRLKFRAFDVISHDFFEAPRSNLRLLAARLLHGTNFQTADLILAEQFPNHVALNLALRDRPYQIRRLRGEFAGFAEHHAQKRRLHHLVVVLRESALPSANNRHDLNHLLFEVFMKFFKDCSFDQFLFGIVLDGNELTNKFHHDSILPQYLCGLKRAAP